MFSQVDENIGGERPLNVVYCGYYWKISPGDMGMVAYTEKIDGFS